MADITINEGELATADLSQAATDQSMDICAPVVSEAFDEQLLSKKRACMVREATVPTLQITMRDKVGNALDLTQYSIGSGSSSSSSGSLGGTVQIRFREASLVVSTTYAVSATIVEATAGLVSCTVPTQVMSRPGIWFAEAGALDSDDNLMFTEEVYLWVEHSAWTASPSSYVHGPPAVDELRLALRDNSPYENELTEEYDYGIVEMCHAAIRTINYWNEQPPIIAIARYSTITFPFREIWTRGTKLFLFQMAEEHYRRNHFKHSSGGVTSDDKNRHREYNAAVREEFALFRQLVMHQKARINAGQCFSTLGSGYGFQQ